MTAITQIESGERTIKMLAHFLHVDEAKIKMDDNLRKDWDMEKGDFEILKQWIEGPISPSIPGFFQDVCASVSIADLVNPKKAGTVQLLAGLIWKGIPDANKS